MFHTKYLLSYTISLAIEICMTQDDEIGISANDVYMYVCCFFYFVFRLSAVKNKNFIITFFTFFTFT